MEDGLRRLASSPPSLKVSLSDQPGQKKDVKTFIESFIRNHKQTLSEQDKKEIIEGLSKRAGGM
jgi:uncharacterized membrane protein